MRSHPAPRPWWRRPTILVGLTAVLVMGMGLRAAYLQEHLEKDPTLNDARGEAAEHRALARQVAHGYLDGPELLAADPLYPLALGLQFRLLGESPGRLAAAQALLGLLVLGLAFWLGLKVTSAEVGILAAGLLALYGPLLHFESQALPTTLTLALHLAALIAAVSAVERARPLASGLAGALLGLSAWARPSLLLLPLVRGLGALPDLLRQGLTRNARRLTLGACLACGLAVLLTPLYLRNAHLGAPGTLLPCRTGLQLYAANHPEARGDDVPPPGFTAPRNLWFLEARQQAAGGMDRPPAAPAETSRHFAVLAARAVAAAPGEALLRLGTKSLVFAHAEELPASTDPASARKTHLALRLAALPFSLLFCLGLYGLLFAELRGRAWLLASLAAHGLAALLLPASSEARITLAPVLAVAAGAALCHLVRHASWRPAALPAGGLALAAGLALSLVPLPGGPRRATKARLEDARALLSQGRPWAAREALGPLLAASGAPPRALHLEGLAHQQLGRHAEALGWLDQALARLPRSAQAHVDLARSYAALAERAAARGERGEGADRLHEALSHLEKALTLQPDLVDGLLLSAQLHRAMGRRHQARERLDRAQILDPAGPEVQVELGILAALGSDPEEARAHFVLARLLGANLASPWDSFLEPRTRGPGLGPAASRRAPGGDPPSPERPTSPSGPASPTSPTSP